MSSSLGHCSANTSSTPVLKLYRHPISGHCHRVELFLSLLNLPVELMTVDLKNKVHKSPEFLAKNPFGQIPVVVDGPTVLADSNAILVYLAHTYAPNTWLPYEPLLAAHVQRWLSVAAGPLAFGPAAARVAVIFNAPNPNQEAINRAHALFQVMEQTLAQTPYLIGAKPSLADIANYSYVARAPEGNVSLQEYPQLRAWLTRIEALPGFVPMLATAVGLAAV